MKFLKSLRSKNFCFSLAFLITSLTAFGQNKNVGVYFNHVDDQMQAINFFKTYENELGQAYKISRVQCYVSQFSLFLNSSSAKRIDTFFVLNAQNFERLELGDFELQNPLDSLEFYFGIDSLINHADPSIYPENHPLAIQNPSMHWGWAGGYRFWAIEGVADTTGNGTFDVGFQYHIAGDRNLTRMVSKQYQEHGDSITYIMNMDIVTMLGKTDFKGITFIHGGLGGPYDIPLDTMINRLRKGMVLTPASLPLLDLPAFISSSNRLFPNPSKGKIHIESAFDIRTIELWDLQGRILKLWHMDNHASFSSDFGEGIPQGTYMLRVIGTDGSAINHRIQLLN